MFYHAECNHDYVFIDKEIRDDYAGMDTLVWTVYIYKCTKCGKMLEE